MPIKNGLKTSWPDLKNVFILACFIGIAFLPCLGAQFVYWDDDLHLLNNPLVYTTDFGSIASIFQTVINKTYIPLTILSFNLEYCLFGLSPFVYHLDNLILHILVCILVYALVRRMGFEAMIALLAALLFGIHPMHVESVAWVTQRKDVLYALFYVLSIYHYWNHLTRNNRWSYTLSLAFGFLSILAKPMALSLPLVLLLLDWYHKGPLTQRSFVNKIPFLIAIVPIAWLTYTLNARTPTVNGWESFLIWSWTATFYIKKFFTPFVLLPLYQLPQPINLWNASYASSILIMAGLLTGMFWFRKNRLFLFGCWFYILSTFFIWRYDNTVDVTIVGDRFMYLPSLGICLWLAAVLGEKLKNKHSEKRFVVRALVIVVLFLAVKTSSQCRVWKDDISLWDYVLGHGQPIALAYNSRGAAFSKLGEQGRALEDINKALQLKPNYALAYYNRGKIHAGLNDNGRALEDFTASLKINPKHEKSFLERGIIKSKENQLPQALDDFNNALKLDPKDAAVYNNRGIVYKKMGQWEQALADYSRALAFNPRSGQAYVNRSSVWKELKRYNEAKNDIQKAQELGFPVDSTSLRLPRLRQVAGRGGTK